MRNTRENDRLLKFPEVKAIVGLGGTTIRKLELQGKFPRRITLGPTLVHWSYKEVQEYLERVTEQRDTGDDGDGEA